MLAITGLHHVSLAAADVVRGSDWYERVLLLTWAAGQAVRAVAGLTPDFPSQYAASPRWPRSWASGPQSIGSSNVAAAMPTRRWLATVCWSSRGSVGVDLVEVAVAVVAAATARPLPHQRVGRAAGLPAEKARAGRGSPQANFSGIDLAGSNNVTVVAGARQSVVVHADTNLLGHVTTQVRAGKLIIGDVGSFAAKSPMYVEIGVPSLAALDLSGSGTITVTGIKASRLTVTLPGSGDIHASGSVTQLNVSIDGSGDAQCSGLIARNVDAVVRGSGAIFVTATQSLDAKVPGSGAVFYGGNPPQVTTSITGSGAVTPG